MLPARFDPNAARKPNVALSTAKIQGSSRELPAASGLAEFCGRCCEMTRKKIRKAANSKALESGSRTRQFHKYTVAPHRTATPMVQSAQQIQAARIACVAAPRSFGME